MAISETRKGEVDIYLRAWHCGGGGGGGAGREGGVERRSSGGRQRRPGRVDGDPRQQHRHLERRTVRTDRRQTGHGVRDEHGEHSARHEPTNCTHTHRHHHQHHQHHQRYHYHALLVVMAAL